MDVKNLRLAKNACWTVASITFFFLILGDTKNNLLNLITFTLIILGIVFSALQDKKSEI